MKIDANAADCEAGRRSAGCDGDDAMLVGFTTYSGTVTAASSWDAPAERKNVRPALENSFDHTRAVEPLEKSAPWIRREIPETYPTGM